MKGIEDYGGWPLQPKHKRRLKKYGSKQRRRAVETLERQRGGRT